MNTLRKLVRRPRTHLLWKVSFQLHAWLGLLLTIYILIISTTGAILVFRTELERLFDLQAWPAKAATERSLEPDQVVKLLQVARPGKRLVSLIFPDETTPQITATMQGGGERVTLRVNPYTGEIRPADRERSWLATLADLHATWLLGRQGRTANGFAAILLLLVTVTGVVIWWPGTRAWRRALLVDCSRTWRRINFDLHRAVGFWTAALLCCWAISGIYFAWPKEVFSLVNRVSPIISAQPPTVHVIPTPGVPRLALSTLVATALRVDAGTTLQAIHFPYSRRAPFEFVMRRGQNPGREYSDVVYLNPSDGSHLRTWRYGVNESWGDWIIWSQVPLHFGRFWGLGGKVVWATCGLGTAVLAATGALLYWNRVLRRVRIFSRGPS